LRRLQTKSLSGDRKEGKVIWGSMIW